MLPTAEARIPALTSGEEIFSLAAGVDLAALDTHQGARDAQGKKPHQGVFRKKRALRVGEIWAKWSGTHQDGKCSWSKTVSGSALDSDGNTVSSGGTTNTYDFENHMLTHGAASMVYDGDGNRVSETAGGVTTKYLVDALNPTGYSQVIDEVVSGAVTKTYTYGRQRISENQLSGSTWTPTFYGYDGHGNTRFLANTAGTLTDTYQFDAFGVQIASTGTTPNPYLYSGERFDSSLNLYHLRARYYNMLTGRFETMDPGKETCCALRASQIGNISDPRTLHKYVYAANDPVNRVDPTGRDAPEYVFQLEVDIEVKSPLSLEMRATAHVVEGIL
jgi:RHS repeat-associated protein